ncbi:transcription antiterminator [Lacticaseibacillus sp. 866-1]|uniref:BglG family transcription antiterminator n=1 Tax=Lacticaseibacillus sp. 866-1 TaxID=2799576 RepID=UPI001944D666|nr:PRD domain-containing protein [Lacticaseibacillus sp. 866-1]
MRTYLILKALAQADTYLSLNYFMDDLKVSKRTVQNELAFIKRAGHDQGYQLRNAYGKGYALEVMDKDLLNAFLKALSSDDAVLNEEELVVDILGHVLTSDQPYTAVGDLAEEMGISGTLLYTKLNTVDNFVESFGLRLERKSHYGIRLVGTSRAIRQLMLELYLKGDNYIVTIVDERVGTFDEYERIAEDCIRENQLRIGYYEFQVLMDWLRVLVVYATLHPSMQRKSVAVEQHDAINSCMNQVLKEVIGHFQIDIDEDVVDEFQSLVEQSLQRQEEPRTGVNQTFIKDSLRTFFTAADAKNHTRYAQDDAFIEGLTTHLTFLLERLDKKITYKNPLLLELCIRYPMVFDLVLKFSQFLESQFQVQVSNDELGFIAIHFLNHLATEQNRQARQYRRVAVICTTGGGVSNLIRTQIVGIFPQSTVKSFSFWEEADLEAFKPDLIFSVVPLKREPKVPTLYIKELLTNRDIDNIKRALFIDRVPSGEPTRIDVANDYLDLIKPQLFHVQSIDSYQKLIQAMAREMSATGFGDSDFEQNVLKREAYMSTVYNNGIAMPHPIEMKGKASAIAVSIVKPEVREQGKIVRLVFMVCLAKQDFQYYSSISNSIFQLMQSEPRISQVYNDPTLSTLVATLKGLED